MKKSTAFAIVFTMLAGTASVRAQEMPEFPQPTTRHEWLQQFVGSWKADVRMFMPGQAPTASEATMVVRSVGGFWTVGEIAGTFMEQPFIGLQTLGYDVEQEKYVGTWVDSFSGYLWTYEGSLNEAGDVLTLHTRGPCPAAPGRLSEFKEVIEVKSQDHHVFTSSMKGEDGKWTTNMTIDYRRQPSE